MYESGQSIVEFVALTDQGDHKDFRSADALWSGKSGFAPDIKPNGLATGGAITAASGNDTVSVAALTCYLAGTLTSVDADASVSITRPTGGSPANSHNKSSITITGAGAIAVVKGDDGTSFSTTRGEAGGPPYIPLASIEIGQVWLSSATPAAITASEIKTAIGSYREMYNYPVWTENRFRVENGVLGEAGITFASALPLIHSAASPVEGEPKAVYAEYYEPDFSEVPLASDFVPPETSHSVSSQQIYQTTLGSRSSSLNQGSFTAFLTDGISDPLLTEKDSLLFFRFYQDANVSLPYILTQGTLGIGRTFPAGAQIQASCTITAEQAAVDVLA
jgi:hypothetical protein